MEALGQPFHGNKNIQRGASRRPTRLFVMLVQFGVTNFRSIKEKIVLSLAASADNSHERVLITPAGKTKLLPAVAIYGANASGKSNILLAVQTMQSMLTGVNSRLLKEKKLPYDPYMFLETPTDPTEFEVIYLYQKIKYAYSFSYNEDEILSEYLYHWPKGREALIFSRENGRFKFTENVSEQSVLASRTPSNKLYMVSSNEWNAPQTASAYRWFTENLQPCDEHITPEATSRAINCQGNRPVRDKILNALKTADLGINNVHIENNLSNHNKPSVSMVHKVTNDAGDIEQYAIPLERESNGTQRFFSRIGPWIIALEKGGILFVDDIEASMHPLLTKHMVEMMQNPEININGAQLVFTTHDTMLLNLSVLRRDQIWFSDKNDKTLSSSLFSLWDFSVRKDENIQKGYLQGRFGAIPFFGNVSSLIK